MFPPDYTQRDAEFDAGYDAYDPHAVCPHGATAAFRDGWFRAALEDGPPPAFGRPREPDEGYDEG
jgi:hypothetical protein